MRDLSKCNCESCNCEETFDECREPEEIGVEKITAIISILFFWHVLLLEILVIKRIQKELVTNPEKTMESGGEQ